MSEQRDDAVCGTGVLGTLSPCRFWDYTTSTVQVVHIACVPGRWLVEAVLRRARPLKSGEPPKQLNGANAPPLRILVLSDSASIDSLKRFRGERSGCSPHSLHTGQKVLEYCMGGWESNARLSPSLLSKQRMSGSGPVFLLGLGRPLKLKGWRRTD